MMRSYPSSRGPGSVALLFLFALGCGRGEGTVTGKVTYRDKPLPSGIVVFVGEDGVVSPPAHLAPDGSYTAIKVPVGRARIAVDTVPPPPPENRNAKEAMDAWKAALATFITLPARYKDPNQSGKTFEVKAGKNSCDISLD